MIVIFSQNDMIHALCVWAHWHADSAHVILAIAAMMPTARDSRCCVTTTHSALNVHCNGTTVRWQGIQCKQPRRSGTAPAGQSPPTVGPEWGNGPAPGGLAERHMRSPGPQHAARQRNVAEAGAGRQKANGPQNCCKNLRSGPNGRLHPPATVDKAVGLGPESGPTPEPRFQHHTVRGDILCRRRTGERCGHAVRPIGADGFDQNQIRHTLWRQT